MKRYFDELTDYLQDFVSGWDYDVSELESYKCTRYAQNFARFADPDDEVHDEAELFLACAREVYAAVREDGFYQVFRLPERWEKLFDEDSERAEKILNRANQVVLNILEKWI